MSNSSLAAQAVAQGPMTAAPPSFDGHGWLFVINLAGMTTCTLIAVMVLLLLATDSWRFRRKERETGMTAARVWRRIGLLYAGGVALRSAGAAWVLWCWNPLDPAGSAQALMLQRILDPAALICAVIGLGLFVVSLPGMLEKLRRAPPPIKMWLENRMLWRIGGCATLSFIAAIGVVSTR
jgi:heme/copper-type cytochrome/quinol oxidase subunit 2